MKSILFYFILFFILYYLCPYTHSYIFNYNEHILLMLMLMCSVYVASTARLPPHLWLCFGGEGGGVSQLCSV